MMQTTIANKLPIMNSTTLKLCQLNMGRGAIVNDQLLYYCQNNEIDIALIQEPYTRRGILTGLEAAPLRTYLCPGALRPGSEHIVHGSAILVLNPSLRVLAREDLTTDNFTVLSLDTGNGTSITFISAYLTALHVAELEKIIDQLTGSYLICADVNAFSQRWFSRITDGRGELVEALIDNHNLSLHNKKSRFKTFTGSRGKTNIDITISSSDINCVENWTVIQGETTSDHAI